MDDVERRRRNQELTVRLREADPNQSAALLDELILGNLDVARAIARRSAGGSGFGADLEQVAFLALVRAARHFDASRGHEFLPYAIPWIKGGVRRFFRDSAWMIRPPRAVQRSHVAEQVRSEHVAGGLRVATCLRPWSLDAPAFDSDETSFGATLVDQRDNTWQRTDDHLLVWQHVRRLPPRIRLMLHLRFVEDWTQQAIATELGVTQYHVSRLLARTLRQLREQISEAASAQDACVVDDASA